MVEQWPKGERSGYISYGCAVGIMCMRSHHQQYSKPDNTDAKFLEKEKEFGPDQVMCLGHTKTNPDSSMYPSKIDVGIATPWGK